MSLEQTPHAPESQTVPAARASGVVPADAALLKPYVPLLVVDWLRNDPAATHRELEATMVFVDISGFTALTERLARRGKVGAELMRDTLDGVFRALLDEAYEWGAGLLKWGGDALLLLFAGEGHEARACRAAWEMQRTIDRVGRLNVSGGTIVLRMSVGIGTGTFHFFMAGSVHRELLVAGPAMSETLEIEGIADAGEVGISHALAARLDPACVGAPKGKALLLAAPPEALRSRAPDVGDVSALDIASCIPVAARAHVLLERSEPEHRTITAAFIDLMDTDRLLEELGPEGLAEGLDERMSAIQEAALRYEVPFYESDVGKSSVKALLTAGAPSSTGQDEERMLRTLRDVMDRPGIVPMRIGVNTGKVFTGDFGPPYRRAYRVFGDAINTAARVMSKAEAGQILSTEIVLDRARTVYETVAIPPFAAKGKAEPVRASVVGAIVGVKEEQRSRTPLIGRDAELQALLDVVEQVREGTAWIVELSGAPGLGKTRLVEELIARAPDIRTLHTRCEEYESSTPYFAMRAVMRDVLGVDAETQTAAVVEALRAKVRDASPELLEWLPLLAVMLGIDLPHTETTRALDERFLRDRLAEVAMRFLTSCLAGAPVMLVAEDVHFIDEASRDLLLRLTAAGADERQMLLVTHRATDVPFVAETEVPSLALCVAPLQPAAVRDLVEVATDDDPLPPHHVDEVVRRSGGNILFLFELLSTVRETGSIEALPDSVESLIAGDIDRLSPTDRTVLRYAAVLGASFDPELLTEAVRGEVELDDEVWSRLSDLLRPEASGALRFRNTLIRDAAYEGLPYRRRRVLHERVGETIERREGFTIEEEIGTLALHYFEAQRWDKAWAYCRRTGDRAKGMYANVDAARSYERALVAGRRLRAVSRDDLAAVYELLGDVRYRLGEFDRSDEALRHARRLVPAATPDAARLALKQANNATRVGGYSKALRRVSRALHELEGVRGRAAAAERARLFTLYGWARFCQGRPGETIGWCSRSVEEAHHARAKDALAQAYRILDAAYTYNGEIEKAVYGQRALDLYEDLGDLWQQASTLNNLGVIAKDLSRWPDARGLYERAYALYETTGDRSMASLALYNLAEILVDQGRYDEAEPHLREVLRTWRAAGAETEVALARRELARIAARRGAFETAFELFAAARAAQERNRQVREELTTDCWIAEAHALAGSATSAVEHADAALARVAATDGGAAVVPIPLRARSWGLLQLGRLDDAEAGFAEALAAARERGNLLEVALALDGLVACATLAGGADREPARERVATLEQLDVVRLPAFPTAAAA